MLFCLIFSQTNLYAENATLKNTKKAKISSITLKGSINPGISKFLQRSIKEAEKNNADLLIIKLDTPGGLVSSLRDMVQMVLDSNVPVVVYVYPQGAQAASAGAILTLSAHIAAMAPGTNIGAAHPVNIDGSAPGNDENATKKDKSVLSEKAVNDIAAMVRSIAQERGRNEKWAEDAVRKSVSASANEALELKAIDFIAKDMEELISKINGMEIKIKDKKIKISTQIYEISEISENIREKILRTIADPNIAYILMMLGIAGLYFELSHPGSILPGTLGAISLVLALYAMQALPVETTGLLLIFLAFIFLISEFLVTSYGVLGITGIISLFLGSVMLYDTPNTGIAVSHTVLYPVIITFSLIVAFVIFITGKSFLKKTATGKEGIVGETGIVLDDFSEGRGKVHVHGEIWNAVSETKELKKNDEVKVVAIKGLKLIVENNQS